VRDYRVNVKRGIGWLLMGLWLMAEPSMAHHSAAAEYESSLVTVRGTVIQFDWRNPHVYIYLEVKDSNGKATRLNCEANGPSGLIDNGWNKDMLKPGDKIALEGHRAKYRPNGFKVHTVTLPNGTRMLME
jgi:hypothetical protein